MKNLIISIGRQFGSGGRVIGQALAKRLNIDYYDKELLELAAQNSGISSDFFKNTDEKNTILSHASEWFSNIGNLLNNNCLSREAIFQIQSDTIRKLADEKSCIIVGRCSDYVLRDNPNCISIFLHSSEENRAKRICTRTNISHSLALDLLREEDKKRATYYNFYTNKTWGDSATYNLSINVDSIGEEQTLELILLYIKMRFPQTIK